MVHNSLFDSLFETIVQFQSKLHCVFGHWANIRHYFIIIGPPCSNGFDNKNKIRSGNFKIVIATEKKKKR